MTVSGVLSLVLLVVLATTAIALVRRISATDEDVEDAGFEHWVVATPGVRPAPPVMAAVVEATTDLEWDVLRAGISENHLGRPVVVVEATEGWAVVVQRRGPAPESLGPCRVVVGRDGWSQLRLPRSRHRGTADEAMDVLWRCAAPWVAGAPWDDVQGR